MGEAKYAVVIGSLWVLSLTGSAEAAIISLDPSRTYFHTDSSDTGADAIPIDLGSLGLVSGDLIGLRVVGDFSYCTPGSSCDFDTAVGTTAVFSSSPTLLGRNESHRIPGAIDAGFDHVTGLTFFESEPTDIPQDFFISSFFDVFVEIPVGATHLFLAPIDSYWQDNHDPDGDYGVSISEVPEPSALALLGAGLASFATWRRRKRS